jgi:hypothetical protein
MANEIGNWANGAGGATRALNVNQYLAPVTAASAYTASSGDTITHVRFYRASGSGTKTVSIGLYEYDSGTDRPTGPVLQEVQIVSTAAGQEWGADVSWSLTNGLDYVLAIGELVETSFNIAATTLTAGTSNDDSGDTSFPTWGHVNYSNVVIDVAGDVTAGASSRPNNRNPFSSPIFRSAIIG